MTITSSNHNPDGNARVATGSFEDTGTVKQSIIHLGWKPRYFKIFETSTPKTVEVTDGMPAAYGIKTIANGTLSYETSAMPTLIEGYDSGAVNTWTVYNTQLAAATDNSSLNTANQLLTGVSIPAALVATSVQAHWIAIG